MMRQWENRGSILIWTLLLGISLATVFFFFAQRLNANSAAQRETIKYQNANTLLESYADYLESLSLVDLEAIRDLDGPYAGTVSFEGITGTVTNVTAQVTGELDEGDVVSFGVIPNGGSVTLDWNLCPEEEGRILKVDGNEAANSGSCAGDYENSVSDLTIDPLPLEAPYAPVSYRITVVDDAVLLDEAWLIDLEMIIGARKKISINRTVTP